MDKGEIDRAFPGRSGSARHLVLAGAAGIAGVAAGAAAFSYLPMEHNTNALSGQEQASGGVMNTIVNGAGEIAAEGAADIALGLIGAIIEGIFS